VSLVWWERFSTKSAALKREAEVKKWSKSRKEKLAMLHREPLT
jgi:predicted GIY-YIG superfamily endonuclease